MLALAALDALPAGDRAALEAHAATCEECARELAALRDSAASLGASLPARPIPADRSARLRARLVARAAVDREGVNSIASRASAPPALARPARPVWLAAAALLLAAMALAYAGTQRGNASRLASDVSRLRDTVASTQRRLAEEQAIVAALTGPGVRVIDASAANARQPYARMFWNQPANQWTFIAYNLPATAPGHTYQLWLVTRDQRKVSAGTFAPSPDGSAIVHASYALAGDSLAAIAVTNEPVGGSPQPTSTPFLVGAPKTE